MIHPVAIALMVLPCEAFFVVSPLQATTAVRQSAATGISRTAMRVTGIESTPNPSSFKFDLDQSLGHRSKGVTYSSGAVSEEAPEAILRLLELQGVESVYALADWLCLNKKPSAKWDKIVPAAVEALGGAAESLDPLTLLMASGGDGGSSWKRSEMDGIAIRLQVSNGIPIQVEACSPGGTPLRRKLSSRFVDAMADFVSRSGDEMAFFRGREWLPRGVRYPTDGDQDGSGSVEEALALACDEVELAYHESRLHGAVDAALGPPQQKAEAPDVASDPPSSAGGSSGGNGSTAEEAKQEKEAAAHAAVRVAAATLQLSSASKGEVVGAVDTLCAIAGNDALAAPAKDALSALVGFTGSGDGPVAARRAAVAYIGGAGDAVGSAGLEAVAAVFRGDKNAGVRRTAGDALSDLGDPAAVPVAIVGLRDKSKLVRWRAARVVGELASREQDAVSLDEARGGEEAFEVAFEMSDAARKIRARARSLASGGEEAAAAAAAAVGPVWKQIQERGSGKQT